MERKVLASSAQEHRASAPSSAGSTSPTTSGSIRLPRHGASLPGRRSACRARPTARRSARSRPTACSSSSSRRDPAKYLPDITRRGAGADRSSIQIDLDRPMAEILAELSKHPVKTTRLIADRADGRRPRHRPRQASRSASTPASRSAPVPSSDHMPSTTRARRRRRRGTRRVRLVRRRPAGWTPMSRSSSVTAARW